MKRFALAILIAVCLSGFSASIKIAWDPYPEAVEYVLFTGSAPTNYDRVQFVTNATCTVTNLEAGRAYHFKLYALTYTNGSEPAFLTAAPRLATFWLEYSETPNGPWIAQASNRVDAAPGFYRGRLTIE